MTRQTFATRSTVRTVLLIAIVVTAGVVPGGTISTVSGETSANVELSPTVDDIYTSNVSDNQSIESTKIGLGNADDRYVRVYYNLTPSINSGVKFDESIVSDVYVVNIDNSRSDVEYTGEWDVNKRTASLVFKLKGDPQEYSDSDRFDFGFKIKKINMDSADQNHNISYDIGAEFQSNTSYQNPNLNGDRDTPDSTSGSSIDSKSFNIVDDSIDSLSIAGDFDLTNSDTITSEIKHGPDFSKSLSVAISEGSNLTEQAHLNIDPTSNKTKFTIGVKPGSKLNLNSHNISAQPTINHTVYAVDGANQLNNSNDLINDSELGPKKYQIYGVELSTDIPTSISHTKMLKPSLKLSNTGGSTYTDTAELVVNGTVSDARSVTVEPGTTETVELSHTLENASAGEALDVVVRGDHDRVAGTTEIVDPPRYALALNETTYSHERNGTRSLPIAGTITNVGGTNATDPVDVTVDLGSGAVRRTATVDGLDAGESRPVAVTFDDGALEPLADGTHPIIATESATDGTTNATLSLSTADPTTATDDGTNTTATTDGTNTTETTDGTNTTETTDGTNTTETTETTDDTDGMDSEDPTGGGGAGTGTSGDGVGGGGGGGSGGWTGPVNDGDATVNGSHNESAPAPERGVVGPGSVSLADPIVDAASGDVVELTVTADELAEGGALVIGNETTTGYEAAVRITSFGDADAVTVRFNTYTAGTTAAPVVELDPASAAAGATIEFDPRTDQRRRADALAPGEYPVTVSTAQHPDTAVANPADVGVLTLAPADSGSASSWTTSAETAQSILAADSPAGALSTALADGTVTRSDTVAYGDVAVLRIDSAGVSGLLAVAGERRPDAGATERFRALTSPDWSPIDGTDAEAVDGAVSGSVPDETPTTAAPIDLDLAETPDSVGPIRSPRTVDPDASAIEVVPDHDRDRVTLFVDTAELRFQDGSVVDPVAEPAVDLGFSVSAPRIRRQTDRAIEPVGVSVERRSATGLSPIRTGLETPSPAVETASSSAVETVPSSAVETVPSSAVETVPSSAVEITPLSDGSEATTGFTVVERDVRFAADPYDAHAAPGQSFAGTTTLAPGTEFTIRVRPIDGRGSAFRARNDSIRVAADGTWSATVDLSALTVGDRYRVSVHGLDGFESHPTVEGRIRAADPATETMTGTPPAAVASSPAAEGPTNGAGGEGSGTDGSERPAGGSGSVSGDADGSDGGSGAVEVVGRHVESVVGTLAADPIGSLLAAFEAIRSRIDVDALTIEAIASAISLVLFGFATYRRVR